MNINLCELLKGHEGETFYSPLTQRNITLVKVDELLVFREHMIALNSKGAFYPNGECMLFPSKDQRDWNKWVEEQKPKVPKTWNELERCNIEVWQAISQLDYGSTEPIIKSALALLKIHQLIEVGYGGNITDEEWKNISTEKCVIERYTDPHDDDPFFIEYYSDLFHHIAFHTKEQAKEFMSYPENVQLLKDFYMI